MYNEYYDKIVRSLYCFEYFTRLLCKENDVLKCILFQRLLKQTKRFFEGKNNSCTAEMYYVTIILHLF